MKHTAAFLMSITLVCTSGIASATQGELMSVAVRDQPFDSVDKNKDGFVDRGEGGAAFHKDRDFVTADANKDGKLNRDEYNAYIILQKDRENSESEKEWSQ